MMRRVQAKQSPISQLVHVYSHRYKFSATIDSDLELDYYNWRHFCFDFPYFEMQPNKIRYVNQNQRLCFYTADGKYIDADGLENLDEVKYCKDLTKPGVKTKHTLIEESCANQGIRFNVINDKDIRVGSRAANLRIIAPCFAMLPPVQEMKKLINSTNYKEAHINRWTDACVKLGISPCLIRRAIAHKLFSCDITNRWEDLYLYSDINQQS